jgi:16S rRNA (uracil1498-N3)-methyltransferase
LTAQTRLVLPGAALTPGELLVPREVARHALVALVAPGEPIEVLNLTGVVGIGVLLCWEGTSCRVTIERLERERGEPPAALVLALSLLHTAAFDWAVEKATELGATCIVPVLAQRCQGGGHAARCARWQRVATAAVAQCGRTRAPEVRPPQPLAAVLGNPVGVRVVAEVGAPSPVALRPAKPGNPSWVRCERAEMPMMAGARRGENRSHTAQYGGTVRAPSTPASAARSALAAETNWGFWAKDGITLLVGPEGGFTAQEGAAIRTAGFIALPIGPRTLRAETAATAGLALVQSLAGWLG